MRRLLAALSLFGAACHHTPSIDDFSADNRIVLAGQVVHLTWSVSGSNTVRIDPEPGPVSTSPVAVFPEASVTYTLTATNNWGTSSRDLAVTVETTASASILRFSVTPAQARAGVERTLSWQVRQAASARLSGGALAPGDVGATGQLKILPAATTTYTLTVESSPGFQPAEVQDRVVARVVVPTVITSFTASPASILQGQEATLQWSGSAQSWSLASGGSPRLLGVARTLVVRPSSTTTYALTGSGPGGNAGPQLVTVTVTPRAGTTLAYTAPAAGLGPLRLEADACPAPCTSMTLRLVAAADVSLRGVAIDLPLDASKLLLDPATFSSALDAGKAVLGTGPLAGTLVLGAAKLGSGSGPAPDKSLAAGAELAHFSVALSSAGGQGVVFDGAQSFNAFIQSASGRSTGGIAVGRLEAK